MPTITNYNPDVLSCLANLSSDEVFTPPGLANQMLDLLPDDLWRDPNARFLDPCCKSGVFLREIARRLDKGMESQIPDRQARINHIMTRQLFGIAITELTALMSRRSVCCSKPPTASIRFAPPLIHPKATSAAGASNTPGKTGAVSFAAQAKPTTTAARNWKPTPTSSSTLTTWRRSLT